MDAGYRFFIVDVGNNGSNSDTGIFKHSHFGQKFLMNDLGLPSRKPLPGFPEAGLLPHCFICYLGKRHSGTLVITYPLLCNVSLNIRVKQ